MKNLILILTLVVFTAQFLFSQTDSTGVRSWTQLAKEAAAKKAERISTLEATVDSIESKKRQKEAYGQNVQIWRGKITTQQTLLSTALLNTQKWAKEALQNANTLPIVSNAHLMNERRTKVQRLQSLQDISEANLPDTGSVQITFALPANLTRAQLDTLKALQEVYSTLSKKLGVAQLRAAEAEQLAVYFAEQMRAYNSATKSYTDLKAEYEQQVRDYSQTESNYREEATRLINYYSNDLQSDLRNSLGEELFTSFESTYKSVVQKAWTDFVPSTTYLWSDKPTFLNYLQTEQVNELIQLHQTVWQKREKSIKGYAAYIAYLNENITAAKNVIQSLSPVNAKVEAAEMRVDAALGAVPMSSMNLYQQAQEAFKKKDYGTARTLAQAAVDQQQNVTEANDLLREIGQAEKRLNKRKRRN